MRILYCIDSLGSGGGTERVLATKVNWLANRPDIDEAIVTLEEKDEPFFKIDEKVDIIRLRGIRKGNYKRRGEVKKYKEAIEEIAHQFAPDVMVAVAGMSMEVLPRLKYECKKILEFHYTRNYLVNFVKGIENLRFRRLHIMKMMYLQWKLKQIAKKYDRFVGLTAKDVELWGNPENMTYVHNPLSFVSAVKSTCKNKIIIGVGSWTPSKGFDRLLEAFGPLAAKYPEWKVELYGAGQDEQRLRNIIQRYRMENQATLCSPVPDIQEKLVEASIYAFPSRSDGFGLVITEAMECGLPTVAMDCPCGPCEILDSSTGIVVTDGDISAYRDALERLMADERLRVKMGRAATVAVKRFYPDAIMPRWISLLK